jgi:DNA end-binding protein Ku
VSLPRKDGSVEGTSGRLVWTGQISFGLVSIPVGLYGAVAPSERISFHFLHRKDRSPIQYKKFCSLEGVEVDADEIVRARKTGKNRWVILEKEEFEKAANEAVAEESPGTIEVLRFVPPETVDPLSLDEPYFVVPRRGGEKAYGVLRDALLDRRRAGIVRFAFRTRPHLGALLPGTAALSLTTLRPFEEMRNPSDLEVPRLPKRPAEIKLAELLIDRLSGDGWDPAQYPDAYRKALEKLLTAKRPRAGKGPPRVAEKGEKVVSLMEALERSLARGQPAHARSARRVGAA